MDVCLVLLGFVKTAYLDRQLLSPGFTSTTTYGARTSTTTAPSSTTDDHFGYVKTRTDKYRGTEDL